MNMKKLLCTIALLTCAQFSFAQNPLWVMAPKYAPDILLGQITNLPIAQSIYVNNGPNDLQDPYDYYDGSSAFFGSNGISGPSGNLQFFVIDGAIYSGTDGQYLDYAWSSTQPPIQIIGNFMQPLGDGGSEHLIIPHPTICNQYYIFGVLTFWYGDTGGIIDSGTGQPGLTLPG